MYRRPLRLPAQTRIVRRPLVIYKPCYRPDWSSGPWQGFAKNYIRKNLWRVRHILPTFEDALQECGMIFAKCLSKYQGKVDNAAWFMSLFSRAVANRFHRLAESDSRYRTLFHDEPVGVNDEADDGMMNRAPEDSEPESASFYATLAQFSNETQQALIALMQAPSDMITALFPTPKRRGAILPRANPITDKVLDRRIRSALGIEFSTKNVAMDSVPRALRALLERAE